MVNLQEIAKQQVLNGNPFTAMKILFDGCGYSFARAWALVQKWQRK